MLKYFEFYYDSELKHKVGKNLKFRELVICAGESISKSIFVKNLTKHELIQIRFFSDDKDISFMPSFTDFGIDEVKEIVVICKPKITRRDPISTMIKVEGLEKIVTVDREKTR